MNITRADRLNPLWPNLVSQWKERLASLRAQNDAPLSELDTARLRGQILEIKALIALDEEPPVIKQ